MIGKNSQPRINWFPGHMAKALKDVRQKISKVDLVLEVRDARIPLASGNRSLEKALNQKPRVIVLNKANLAEKANIKLWQSWFAERNDQFLFLNSFDARSLKMLSKMARAIMQPKWQKFIKKGIQPPPLRMMLLGIPNTGKSTIINRLTKRKAAGTGDRPGVTRSQEWIVLGKDLELLDTPGIMPPRIDTEEQGLWLCAIHAIKDEIVGKEKVAAFVVKHLQRIVSLEFINKYKLKDPELIESEELILQIGSNLNCRKKGGEIDYAKTCSQILHDFRSGLLGECSFERPPGGKVVL